MTDPSLTEAVRAALLPLARAGHTVSYRDLAALVQVAGPQIIRKLTLALEASMREDHAAGRPLIAALAVSRSGDNLPGRGFFHVLAELGRYDGPDRGAAAARAHATELAGALRYWGGGPSISP